MTEREALKISSVGEQWVTPQWFPLHGGPSRNTLRDKSGVCDWTLVYRLVLRRVRLDLVPSIATRPTRGAPLRAPAAAPVRRGRPGRQMRLAKIGDGAKVGLIPGRCGSGLEAPALHRGRTRCGTRGQDDLVRPIATRRRTSTFAPGARILDSGSSWLREVMDMPASAGGVKGSRPSRARLLPRPRRELSGSYAMLTHRAR